MTGSNEDGTDVDDDSSPIDIVDNIEHSRASAELYEAIEDRKNAQRELLQAHASITTVVRAMLEQQQKGQQQQKQLSMALQKSLSMTHERHDDDEENTGTSNVSKDPSSKKKNGKKARERYSVYSVPQNER